MNQALTSRRLLIVAARLAFAVMALWLADAAGAATLAYPPPEFESGYQIPAMSTPRPRAQWLEVADVVLLAAALSLAAWFALRSRRRGSMLVLSLCSLVYFGFARGGCICPIGAIQNVALALADGSYAVPLTTALFFAFPLAFALLFGRVFCGGVCPLGAIQDVVLVKPLRLPGPLERALSVVPFVYLGLAVLFAVTGTMFIICRYDPFVPFFRLWRFEPISASYPLAGADDMLIVGGVVLLLAMFVGRPYCRFLCPYGVLLGLCARFAWRKVSVTPDECIACTLCEEACPFGAIRPPTPEGVPEQ